MKSTNGSNVCLVHRYKDNYALQTSDVSKRPDVWLLKTLAVILAILASSTMVGAFGKMTSLTQAAQSGFWPRHLTSESYPDLTSGDSHIYLPFIARSPNEPQVLAFTSSHNPADPGQLVLLEWESLYATGAQLWLIRGGQVAMFWDVSPNGNMEYLIPAEQRNSETFLLNVWNESGQTHSLGLTITLTCPHEWFFAPAPPSCPQDEAQIEPAAEQSFEHGTMVWHSPDRMIVLFDEGYGLGTRQWIFEVDTWNPGDPICDLGPPPPGLFHPERGFGKLWCDRADIRALLGWAVEPEGSYETAIQSTAFYRYNSIYVRARDGNVWHLLPEGSEWEKIIVESSHLGRLR